MECQSSVRELHLKLKVTVPPLISECVVIFPPSIYLPPEIPPAPIVNGPDAPVELGTSVTLTCSGEEVKWSRNDSVALPAKIVEEGGNLTIPNLQPQDSGVYLCCSVTNICSPFDLQIERPPEEPTEDDSESSGVSTMVIIIVAAVGGVSLLIFLTVVVVAICYCCSRCRGKTFCELHSEIE